MAPKQEKLIENYVRTKVRTMLKEESNDLDINPDHLESIENFLTDLKNNVDYLKHIIKMNSNNLKPKILQKIQTMKHNIASMEVYLNK